MYFPEWGGGGGKRPYMGDLEAGPGLGYPWSPCSSNRQTKHGTCLIGWQNTRGTDRKSPVFGRSLSQHIGFGHQQETKTSQKSKRCFSNITIVPHSGLASFKTEKKFGPSGGYRAGDAGISFFGDNDKSKYVDGSGGSTEGRLNLRQDA